MALLVALTPIGILLPAYFKSDRSWGEWSPNELKGIIGYLPKGLTRLASLWHAPIPDYALLSNPLASYTLSALIGILAIAGIVYLIGKFLDGK